MMHRPIGAIFHHRTAAETVRQRLLGLGVRPEQIDLELLPIPPWYVLEGFGIPEEVARVYESEIQGGDWVLVVQGGALDEPEIRELLTRQGGLVIGEPIGEEPATQLDLEG